MNYKLFALLFTLILCLGAQQSFQKSTTLFTQTLQELHQLDPDKLDCNSDLLQVGDSAQTWQEIMENQSELESDAEHLQKLKEVVQQIRQRDDSHLVLLQVQDQYRQSLVSLRQVTELTNYQSWRKETSNDLESQFTLLDQATSKENADQCCDNIEKLIDRLLKEREDIKKQCQQPKITINIINSQSDKIQQKTQKCDGKDLSVVIHKDDELASEAPESDREQKMSEPSETSSEAEDEDDKDPDLNTKKKDADFSNPDPVFDKEETDEKEDFKEYGYGFWAKFLLGYPKRLPQGKSAPWYFVSRLTSNKKNNNIDMGDRLLAIWLGKGYYHYTTCDSSKNQPNVVQNINYPEDIDGVWTYIYYSYSVEQKKAVGFIKFGEEDVKKIVHTVSNPLTKFLKFTIGGSDSGRYPGFNGLINQIYFSAKVGVFIDSEEELTGKLQSQKKQMKFFLPETYTYKLVSNPLTREPNTNDIHQIIGAAKNPKIPHEYSFSGWFKWTQPKQQEEWHNAFRVQIATPSTDKFLGDRTLSMWVGKSDGIIHLPTYTYNNMEGDGNANLFKNIPHKDRHTKWFFVYFGYSKPEREAFAYIKWSDSEDSQDYEKVNHFSVPKFYVFVGKDKHFPGFSGQIALAVFNIGEGSFRKSTDYKAKNDIFQFSAGVKKLTGTKPGEDPEKHDKEDDGISHPSSTDEQKPAVDKTEESEQPFKEYGYGFWARFLTAYPTRMINGKNAPWYFVSRLTSNANYANTNMGDRLLAIWQGQGYYHYTTCDDPSNKGNVIKNINYPVDIEGVWTYIYYSYSVAEKKAVGFAKYNNLEPRSILHAVSHPQTKYLKFLLGGKDKNQFPGFNGVFSQVTLNVKEGAFIDTDDDFNDHIQTTVLPKQDLDKLFRHTLVDGTISRKPADLPDYDEVGGASQKFPHEYSYSGWFKWEQVQQLTWHILFRVQISKPSTDRYLGDRTLSCWIGTANGGILHFPTYSYSNMNGGGNPNLVKNIQHRNRHMEWTFIHYGYSKNERKAFVTVRFSTGIETIEHNGINHYYAPKFYIYTGKDQQFQGFNGKLGYVNFVLGEGAFRKIPNFKQADDVFGFDEGASALLKKPQEKVVPVVDKETGEKHIPNSVNDNKPKVDEEDTSPEAAFVEYGYGFWARFLTAYPVRLANGKNAPWYFMSRMTSNKNYGNIGMGDRTLAVWQGQGYYHFTTYDASKNQVNVVKNINYPADIEGLWTYFYYSYSVAEKKAVAFVKYGDGEPLSAEHSVTHNPTKYLRFILGGKDQNRYPGFNGQLASVIHSAKPGVYIGSMDQFKQFHAKQPSPLSGKMPLQSDKVIDSQISRDENTQPLTKIVETQFPKEYSFSGWFKWEQPTPQKAWHNLFRVQINTPSTDKFLGDRTLAMWVGTAAGGILHSTTYTYTNMNGGGNANTPQNILHKNRHLQWFFVYQGYSKTTKEAYTFVKWTSGEDSLEFKNANHYLANKYYVFVGKDVQFPGIKGQVAFVSFNTGEGASKKGNDFTHPTDVFRFDKGKQNLFPKVDPSKPTVDERGEIPNEVNNNSPKVDKSLVDTENLVEYGYGFWARFLTAYPVRMLAGKNAPWYFVSRLTVNQEYDNIRMGDRTLAIWQGQGYYHFTTCNSANGQVNVIQNINYPADIEGLWTYVYYSYSVEQKKAIAFIKFGNDEPKSITHQVTHPTTKQVRFVLGGMDENRYPAFNGLFSKVTYSQKKGAFIDSVNQLKDLHGVVPESIVQLTNNKVVAGVIERAPTVAPVYSIIGDDKTKLPTEYAISGWFNWNVVNQQVWHNVFRVQINTPSTDKYLGDRTLSCWVGTPAGGILHFPTYTYSNMNGAGNANLVQNVVHKNRINNWFFVYYGYSKTDKHAYAYVKFTDSEESLNYANTNHYFAPKFYVYVGKDAHFPGFSGKVAYVNFNVGKNSFKKGNDFTDDGDNFGFSLGAKELFKPVKPEPIPAPDTSVHESKSSEPNPKVDKTGKEDDELKEYGYGFWMRFLTAYPERLLSGKNQPWYFVARLTVHQEYDNIRMGDRTLAIWQGQGYYHFTTCNAANGQVNVIQNINYPDDIEGVWTYVYYSYSVKEQSAIAFIKYGDDEFKTITHKVVHPATKQVRFILGGNDEKRYPAFNGLFTNVYFNAKVGAFIGSMPTVKKFMEDNGGVPSTKLGGLITKSIVTDEITRSVPDAPIQVTVAEKKLPQEYAISGWFRWKTVAPQQAWHNVFRVQIKTPSTDQFLGDRTLSCWVGTPEGGILHFPTYTYTNMNGGGNSNYYKNIKHEDRHNQWFFVYFGYSKPAAQAFVYVKWSKTENNQEYPNTNHYLASEFFIFLGKDTHFPGFNGKIANVQINAGEGAFKKGNDFTDPKDVFGFKAGFDKFGKDEPEPKPEPKPIEIQPEREESKPEEKQPEKQILPIDTKVHENKSSQKEPVLDKEGSEDNNLSTYGYGFWMRFLTVYPERLLAGKNQPWYFVARLTWNKQYDNIRMGDRTLAIWQGQGYYHFTTCNVADGNVNVIQNINYPEDIEGVWTYVYYSYTKEKKAVAFIKYGSEEPKSITHAITHQPTKSVRFVLGGNDEGRYPGFNGLFTSVTFGTSNAFIGTIEQLKTHLERAGIPAVGVKDLKTTIMIQEENRKPADEPKYAVIGGKEEKFPTEYAISGWFKWKVTAQQPWHNLFRVQIKTPSTDQFLGDRTLSCWVGTPEGGILHFPTYTYVNMNGAGNANYYKNIPHKNRHQEWFFVYFGYDKAQSKAYSYVKWTDASDQQTYENTNHYFTPEFYVFVGRDKQFPGHSGKMAFIKFNLGVGAYIKDNKFAEAPEDIFGFNKGVDNLFKKDDKIEPGQAIKDVLTNSFEQKKPVVEKESQSEKDLEEYGYGFWARFLTVYPTRLLSGKNQAWYFVARLTQHKVYDNIRMGDRTLAIWQGQGYYHFTTCNALNNNVNVIQNINYPEDIEGVWTYIYYSYSDDKSKAVGLIKYGNSEIQTIKHEVSHPDTKFVRFILGGNDEGRYPGFNGIFTQVTFGTQKGVFIDNPEQLKSYLTKVDSPATTLDSLTTSKLVDDEVKRVVNDEPIYKVIGEEKTMFPEEYALSGWFKWQPVAQAAWHNIFRVQIKTPSTDNFLGDRTLTLWLGTTEGGILHFPTYTYTNMNGAGNANYYKNIAHKDRHTKWFFVYFGHSRKESLAYTYVKWSDSEDSLTYEKTNHYLVPEFYIFVGRDKHFPGFNGKLGFVNFNVGKGAFRKGNDFVDSKDAFGFSQGIEKLVKKQDVGFKPSDANTDILENSSSEQKPALVKEDNYEKFLEEYGYGFWARFLTVYPERLLAGKNQPWYFVARLTQHKEYDNIRMGDRTLAIWQGQGYYHFTTCNAATNNVNQIQNINYPEDIEGVWTYIYYSYSADHNKAVAFIKYGNGEVQTAVHDTTHPATKYVKFILGGNDEKRYPGFNGLFTSVTFSTKIGAFVDQKAELIKYLEKNPAPLMKLPTSNVVFVKEQANRQSTDEPIYKAEGGGNKKFPGEYAISGWFKWKPTAQQPWHNIFRVQIKTPSTDNFLGDRTLTLWLGTPEGGILHFPTYTYANMNGAGNANLYKNIAHKERHLEWFYVYYGYQKSSSKAYAYVKWTNSEDSLTYDNTNHYLAPEFFIFVGRDKQFPGHSGKLAYVNFNSGEGAFAKDNKFDHPNDIFGFSAGSKELLKKEEQKIEPGKPLTDQLANGFESKKPVLDKNLEGADHLEQYGYGYWARYLTVYPQRLLAGKNAPWYFVSRLTQHKEYDNIRMGDRTLAIWQGQGYYHFTTCNAINGNVNVIQNINYPADIEGVWTYIYYSYSDDKSRAVAFIKYGNEDVQTIRHEVSHPPTKFIRFILGGNDEGRYPGFNGIFTQVTISHEKGVFIDTVEQLKTSLAKIATPTVGLNDMTTTQLVEDEILRQVNDEPLYKVVGDDKTMFPQEYAISGWFKWQPVAQAAWHNLFRVQIKTPSTDNFLGDRTLTLWLGTPEGGIMHFPTYTYSNMVGAGNANYYKNIAHKERHTKWFFVYYGYSKKESQAYAFIKWSDSQDFLSYENANHYYAPEFFVFVGRDKHFPGHNGKLGHVNFNVGKGTFQKGTDFTHPTDAFGFDAGTKTLLKKPDVGFKPSEPEKGVLENAFTNQKPTLNKEVSNEKHLEEYGYGFWARFLTVYPERLLAGKNEAWYFLARLTQHKEYDNIRMGDRTLAIWQGQGYYHFTTCNSATNNVNQIQNINYPADIEGLWTYIYYSYSADENQAVAFIKYGDGEIQSITHKTTHPMTKYVKFILGGNDEKRYPGFNGIFTSVTFSTSYGAYVDKVAQISAYLEKHPAPSTLVPLANELIVKDKVSRQVGDEPLLKTVGGEKSKFPWEYAFSGWFKWVETPQQPWHNLFRVSIKTPSTDQFLGDRTLTCWLGAGILHFPTYTYTNMNGAGNANHHKNINHNNRHFKWFFVYYGYSKKERLANIQVKWSNSDDGMTYEDINHYFTPEFFVYVGKDKHFPGHNGQLGQINFNLGDGAFTKGNNFKHDKNIFGLDAPFAKKTAEPFNLKEIDPKILVSAQDQKTPTFEKTFAGEDVEEITEYGYGFWCRFLTHYPQQLKTGLIVDWSFMARLTKNQQLADIGLGDRTLALWQGKGYYHFTTVNAGNPNAINNINYGDIEGVWTFIYHSHSLDKKQSVAFVKFGGDKLIKNVQAAQHSIPTFLKFYLGGQNLVYKGFNGQFSHSFVSINTGVYQDTEEGIIKFLETAKQPEPFNTKLLTKTVIETDQVFNDKYEIKETVYEDMPLVGEYAWSGWFKWTPCVQQPWHLAVRLSILQASENIQFLGDRTLNLWIGNFQGGIMHFATYSYANIFGGGNVNSVQNILYKLDLPKWHFVYFGYSKAEKMAYAKVEFKSRTEELIYKDHNHFLPNKFSIYMGRDKWHAIYSGQISYFKFNGGPGAFLKDGYDKATDDVFGYGSGKGTLIKPSLQFDAEKQREKKIMNSPQDQKEPVYVRESSQEELQDIEQYGYGFWCRFLTHYPKQLPTGLQPDWSFMARVTKNEKLADIGVGDRTLALWLGKGYYHFTTYNGGNPNLIHNVGHPVDIEGLWTFIYHSHSLNDKQSIVFVKFGNEKLIKAVIGAEHTTPAYLKFYLGGNNMNYAAYNGQFSDVMFSTGLGVFAKDEAQIEKLIELIKSPADYNLKLTTKQIIEKPEQFKPEIAQKENIFDDFALVGEYAWSGWFKWTPCAQQPWHLMVRLSILQSSENIQFLGDRTLNAWVGQGYFHFTSYTYANMYGGGNVNQWQNVNYESDHVKWHFIYFGYSRAERLSYARMEFKGRLAELNFKGTNHYLPQKFSLYAAKDKWHSTYSGNIGYLRFNGGPGAFTIDGHEKAENDIFAYKLGKEAFADPGEPPIDKLRDQEVLASAFNGEELINLEFKKDALGDLDEYGYGFYIRYLQEYPAKLVNGKQAPWYAVSRMTYNEKYDNIGMGDRLLALWQGTNIYAFATIDRPSNNVNHVSTVPCGDIDGVWTFVYMSYSLSQQMAVYITKYDDNKEVFHREHKVNHGKVEYLRVIFGGADKWYPGFNGQYANYAVKFGPSAFVQKYDYWKRHLDNRIPHPLEDNQKFRQIELLTEEKEYTPEQQEDDILTIDEEARFAQEYSISGWVRWSQPKLAPWFLIFRLTQTAEPDNVVASYMFGDFTLYRYTNFYRFHSYSYSNMNGGGSPWTVGYDVVMPEDEDKFWHYIYMGYNRKTRQSYNYISLIDREQEKLFDNINHFLLGKHYLQLGRDFKKHFPSYRGFTGKFNLFKLSYGEGSYQTKQQGIKDDRFWLSKGAKLYQPVFALTTKESETNKLLEAKFDESDPIINWEIKDGEDGQKVNGLNEYGWSLWCRWMRTGPSSLAFRVPWHTLARLTNQKDHKDLSAQGDRTLAAWVGWGFYYFSAYSIGVVEKVDRVNYKVIDGQWNFISFSYKKQVAKGIVLFESGEIQEVNIPGKQRLIQDYLRFIVGKEFGYKFFNGHYINIQLRLGDGAFLDKDGAKTLALGDLKVPDEFRYNQGRKTIPLKKDKVVVKASEEGELYTLKAEDVLGKAEYAISGWAKWKDPAAIGPWHQLYRVTIWEEKDFQDASKAGDRQLVCWKGAGYYHISTTTTNEVNGGDWNLWQNMDYEGSLHKNWVFYYHGYSHTLQKAFAYLKFPASQKTLVWNNINHFVPTFFNVILHGDKIYAKWNGQMEAWYFNVGTGSYKEKDFGVGESDEQTFGFGGRTITPLKPWSNDEVYDTVWNIDRTMGKDVTYEDDSISGITEYAYGMWTRFVWNGKEKLIAKPAWMALSRLTINEDYQRDAGAVGDRALAIWVGAGYYHFTTSTPGNVNVVQNINYNQMLDGQWNYIYFGYKKFPAGGKVAGHVLFEGLAARSTSYPVINHPPVTDYLYFVAGSSGAKLVNNYHSFNGKIAQVNLYLGDGSFQESVDDLKKVMPKIPSFPALKINKETIIEEAQEMKRAEAAVEPKEFEDQFEGANEYSVSIWYKWSTIGRVAWENIYTLTFNEPKVRGNHDKPGDRQLSMFQYADHRTFFSSYTTPDNHDTFTQIYTECPVPAVDQNAWVFGYYAYSKKEVKIVSFLKTRTTQCEQILSAMHRVPKYFGLYVGKDGMHTPYNGKYAHMYLYSGLGAFRTKDYLSFDPYVAGATGIQSKPYKWAEKKAQFEQPFDAQVVTELDVEKVDGHSTYGFGVWTRYLTAIPKRLLEKPNNLSLVRFTINKDHKDYAKTGDRTLAVWIGRGSYLFRTYNQANNNPNIAQDIDYGKSLEGVWNFIYFSYSSTKQQATAFVKFGDSGDVKRVVFTSIAHRPVEQYGKIVVGKEFEYQGFNGQIEGLQMLFGSSGYINDVDQLEKAISEVFPMPEIDQPAAARINIQNDEKVKKVDDAPELTEWPDEHQGVLEYSIFGWFRYSNPTLAKDNNVFLRLTNNEKAYRKEYGQMGDRTLLIMLQPREVVFATYTMGKIDTESEHNIRKPTPYGNNYGLWTYVWFGYDWNKKQASGVAKFPTGPAVVPYENVLHMVPKYLALFAGSDGMLGGWVGPMQKVGAIFGKGAYVDCNKGNYPNLLPDYQNVKSPASQWKPEKDEIVLTPVGDKPGFDLTFKEEAGGISEYGYGLWTRWLMTTPDRVADKSPFHQLIRLTNTEKYEDNSQLGNRVLAIWVGKGYYHFTTYDKLTNKISTSQNIDYGDYLEGNWNYIYYSYIATGTPRAVGFVHFGDVSGEVVQRVEFLNVQHNPLNGFARVVVANKEFSYPAFNGMLSDLRINFGKGFIGSKEQFLKDVIQSYPKPILKIPIRTDINVLKAEKNFDRSDDKAPIKAVYDQYQGVLEYAVSGWIQAKKAVDESTKSIFRLTINSPGFQKDKHNAGDRTLAAFMNKDEYVFSTYDYGNLDTNDDDQNDMNKGLKFGENKAEWTYLYFGYNLKLRKAYCYALYVNREDSGQYNELKHFVPNTFWFYLGNDGFNQQYEGIMFNWNLHIGDGAFTTKPKALIEQWPYEPQAQQDKVMSALLGNQGLSSVKLIKNTPLSGGLDKASGPVSGKIEAGSGPASGNLDQTEGAKSGEVNQMAGAKSGQTTQSDGAKSGDLSQGDKANSGDIKK